MSLTPPAIPHIRSIASSAAQSRNPTPATSPPPPSTRRMQLADPESLRQLNTRYVRQRTRVNGSRYYLNVACCLVLFLLIFFLINMVFMLLKNSNIPEIPQMPEVPEIPEIPNP